MAQPKILNTWPFLVFYGKPGDDHDAYIEQFEIVAVANHVLEWSPHVLEWFVANSFPISMSSKMNLHSHPRSCAYPQLMLHVGSLQCKHK